MVHTTTLTLTFMFFSPAVMATDPRLEIDEVKSCVEASKAFMRSSDYSGQENESALIGACRDADIDCVKEAGESLRPMESPPEKAFLAVIRACRGKGMGKCFRALKERTSSHDRREHAQVLTLLEKCR